MKKTYVKPELDSRTYAQFENVFTACTRNTNNDKFGCTYCGDWNPGADVHGICEACGQPKSQRYHSRHAGVSGS